MKFFASLLFSFLLVSAAGAQTKPIDQSNDSLCELAVPCKLGNRSYHVRPPDQWDGKSPLPVLLHFHGWGRQGPLIMKHTRIANATAKLGVLLIAPNGQNRTWDFWSADTDDVSFSNAVVEQVSRRWPIDRKKIFVSGYSYGSAMAWRFACSTPEIINTVLAISGSIPNQDEDCAGPVNIRHVHGLKDTVMRYPFETGVRVEEAIRLWRRVNDCAADSNVQSQWQAVPILPFKRLEWTQCQSGKSIILDVHERGHFIPRFWIEKQLTDLL